MLKMRRTLSGMLVATLLIVVGLSFFVSNLGYSQIVETESAGWLTFKPYSTSTWTIVTADGASGATAGSSMRAMYITAAKAGIAPGKYNIEVRWYDARVDDIISPTTLQIGQRTCAGTSTTICNNGTFDVNDTWIADKPSLSFSMRRYSNLTITATDTIFMYTENDGGSGRTWIDYIKFQDASIPIIDPQTFTINKSTSPVGTTVGTVTALGPAGMTYSITGGNIGSAFSIDATTGKITVSGSIAGGIYALKVQVSANGKTAIGNVDIEVLDRYSGGGTSCDNIGFEAGDFSQWQGDWQDRHTGGDTDALDKPGPLQTGFGMHTIMKRTDVDPLIPALQVVAPGSARSARLGNIASGGQIQRLKRSFVVDSSNMIFTYRYAIVLEDPFGDTGHDGNWAPNFSARLLDAAGKPIVCGGYTATASVGDVNLGVFKGICSVGRADAGTDNLNYGAPGIPAKETATASSVTLPDASGTCSSGKKYFWKDWTTISVPLNAFLGKTVTIEFSSADCRPDGHLGYAYVDADCKPLNLREPALICQATGTTTKIHASSGFKSYSWTGPGVVSGATDSVVTVNKIGLYNVKLTPYSDVSGCDITLTYTVKEGCKCTPPTTLTFTPDQATLCEGSSQVFTAGYTLGTPVNGSYYRTIYKDGVVLVPATAIANTSTSHTLPFASAKVTDAGVYKIRIEDGNVGEASCYKEIPVTLAVNAKVLPGTIGSHQTFCGPSTPLALTSTTAATGGTGTITYDWQTSANGTTWSAEIGSNTAGYTPGLLAATTYFRRKASSGICPAVYTDSVLVTINPIPARPTPITGISPACPNSLLTIAGSPPAGIGYFWQGTSATSKLTTMPATAAYDVIVSGKYYARAQNTTTLCWSDSTLIDIIINPLSPGTIGDNTPICEGAVIPKIVSKTPATGGNGTYVYQWESTTDTISGIWTNITGTNTLDYTPPVITVTTFFRRKVTSGTCPNVTQIVTYTYSPKPGPANPVTGPSPVCVNTTNVYTTTPVTYATSYDWVIPSGATITAGDKTTSITVNFSTTPGGIITVTPRNACGIGTPSASLNVLVKPLLTPTVTIQGPDSICTGEPALFFVSAASDSGATPTYKWYVNATQQASTKTTFESTTLVNGDVIKVEMTSSEVCVTTPTATSNTLTMVVVGQVIPGVSITPLTFCSGISQTLTATPVAGGSAPSYVWTLNGGPVGTNSNSYTNAGFVNGDVVKVVMTSNSGCAFPSKIAEKEVTLTVKPIPVVTPASAIICSGTATNIALTTTPNISGTTFEWPVPVSTTVTGGLSGTTASIAHQLNTVSNSPQILTYVVTPTANGCVGLPENIAVTVNPIPTVTGVDGSICSGTSTNIALSSNVAAGVTYNWTGSGNGAATGTANPIAETLTNSTTAATNTSYSITATANGCTGPAKVVNVKVKPLPVTSGLHAPICSNQTISIALNHNITTPGVSSTYAWTASGSSANVTGYAATGTSNPITGTLSNSGTTDETVTYSIIPTVDGCAGNPTPIAVVVKPIPVVTPTGIPAICGGNETKIGVTSSVTGTTYSWTMTKTGAVTGTANGTVVNDSIKEILLNTSSSAGIATYMVTPTAAGCIGIAKPVSVTVNPAPDAKATGKAICSGSGTNITITSGTIGATYAWTSTVTTGTVTGQNPAGGSGATIAETLTNPDPSTAVLTYTITPSANGCTGAPDTVVMTVKPRPVATTVNSKPVLCSGETTSIVVSSSTTTATFAITAAGGAGSTGISGAPNPRTIAQTLSATAQTEVTYTILPTAEGCPGPVITDSVIVHPIPVPDAGADAGYCAGDSAFIGAAVSNPAYSYSWSPSSGLSSDTVARPQTQSTATTTYTVMTILKANPNCKLSDDVKISVSPQFTVNAGPDVLICSKDPVTLTVIPGGLLSYSWNSGPTTATINVAPEDTTMYIVTASNGACKAKDTVMVNVKNIGHPTLYIPNSFTPGNADGNNDIFKVKGEGIIEFEGMIFDRWGTMFYKWTEVSKGWDGTLPNGELALEDVYVYSIKVKNLCDKKFRDPRSGTITIIK